MGSQLIHCYMDLLEELKQVLAEAKADTAHLRKEVELLEETIKAFNSKVKNQRDVMQIQQAEIIFWRNVSEEHAAKDDYEQAVYDSSVLRHEFRNTTDGCS